MNAPEITQINGVVAQWQSADEAGVMSGQQSEVGKRSAIACVAGPVQFHPTPPQTPKDS